MRQSTRFGLTVAMAMLAAAPSRGAEFPLLDATLLPGVSARARASYDDFLLMNLPRAVAFGPNGGYGWSAGDPSIGEAREAALISCAAKAGTKCAIYAEDLQVMRSPVVLAAAPGPLIKGAEYAFVPDARYFWRGPHAARGVYIWGHGTGNGFDARVLQPQPHVRAFNNAGYDIVKFDRDPTMDYYDWAPGWLRDGAARLRQLGYRSVVVGGQSRGANDALFALDQPGLVDGVIAVSPGSYGVEFTADFLRSLRHAASPMARVVFIQFAQDRFAGPDMEARAAEVKELLRSRVGALLLIDRPAGFTGHGAGGTADFAIKFGSCIYRFVTGQTSDCSNAPLPAR